MTHLSPRVLEELRHRDLYAEERRARLDALLLDCLRAPKSRGPLDALTRYLSDAKDPAASVTRHAVEVFAGPRSDVRGNGHWVGGFVLRVRLCGEDVTAPAMDALADNAGQRFWPMHAWPPFCRVWDRLILLAEREGIAT